MRLTPLRLVLSSSLALGAVGAQALMFNFNSSGNAQVDAGFAQAGQMWANEFIDPITINIEIGFRNFGNPNIIGQAGSSTIDVGYGAFRTALIGDAIYPENGTDPQVIASLPNTTGISWRRNNVATGATVVDNDGSRNNNFLSVNTANAKALGLLGANAAGDDAFIEFNSGFNFDFDPSNGIDNDKVDFVGVAFHEIGHALGFVSGVDDYDFFRAVDPSSSRENSLNSSAVFSPLDLLRFTGAESVRDGRYNANSYFSLNSGVTNNARFSTGANNGDGRQASHWKDDDLTNGNYLGAMDPTLDFGFRVQFSVNDGRALDAIGYDVVPEPATMLALAAGVAALGARRRRRAR